MVNFNLCRDCSHGKWDPPKYDKDGELAVFASIFCDIEDGLLLMNSEIPHECPFILEQKLTIQDMDRDMSDRLSGGKGLQETICDTA